MGNSNLTRYVLFFLLNLTTLLTLLKKLPSVLILDSIWFTANWQAPTLSPELHLQLDLWFSTLSLYIRLNQGAFTPDLLNPQGPLHRNSPWMHLQLWSPCSLITVGEWWRDDPEEVPTQDILIKGYSCNCALKLVVWKNFSYKFYWVHKKYIRLSSK